MNELNRQLISMYAKQLRVPTFNQYEEVIRQLDGDKGFDDFLVSLMRAELENRQDGNRKRKIRSARFPYAQFASTDCPFRMSGAGSSVEAVWVSGRIFYLFSGVRSRIFLPFISRR